MLEGEEKLAMSEKSRWGSRLKTQREDHGKRLWRVLYEYIS